MSKSRATDRAGMRDILTGLLGEKQMSRISDILFYVGALRAKATPQTEPSEIHVGVVEKTTAGMASSYEAGEIVLYRRDSSRLTLEYPMEPAAIYGQELKGSLLWTVGTMVGVPAENVRHLTTFRIARKPARKRRGRFPWLPKKYNLMLTEAEDRYKEGLIDAEDYRAVEQFVTREMEKQDA